ncbi:MAG TPA: alpha-glucan family phosphorylase [Pyrinomonadaceae bacterium]|nr:alpha-glucan family phosphorylase [Pyrinomonadaceae bacterium]
MNPEVDTETKPVVRARELPATLKPLEKLAWNYWWSWAPDGPEIFRDLDPGLWQQCEQNPRALLAQTSDLRFAQMAADPAFAERLQQLSDRFDAYMSDARPWPGLRTSERVRPQTPVAYFCAEYGVHSSLPMYSGGLGILAGDHLKSASDLNLPLVAVGLFYGFGYFRQSVTGDDWQDETYKETYPDELPVEPVIDATGATGAPLMIEVTMRGRVVHARAWRAKIGRVQLYLLDTNVPENAEVDRLITGHLYGGDRETRLVQEIMLGIGGVRLLRQLRLSPSVFHMNEGHSAFLSLELAREIIETEHVSFADAAARVRERCVFTTHTPVAAGHDEFSPELITQGFGNWHEKALGLSLEEFLALGRVNGGTDAAFGLTPLALRMSRSINGVSRKHGEVSRQLWQKMWPERKTDGVPITSVTNGVHPATWVASPIRSVYQRLAGDDWLEMARHASAWSVAIDKLSEEELWQAHSLLKQRLVAFVRDRCFDARLARGETDDYIESARTMFDPDVLTIGFARRIAGYKRWDLLLSDEKLLTKLLTDSERPVQFVFAGKAHPHDQGAKLILQKLLRWQRNPSVRQHVAFIEDYDQEVARQLVQGVDVWMNVPRRPQEASGTSGQKAAMNGVLNFSILDGWWLEGYDGQNGFAISDVSTLTDEDADQRDAASMYQVLQEQVIPPFYDRDDDGVPQRWVGMMKRAIQTLVPAFNSDRMAAEYAERIY